jgi:serine/threonine protein kinase
MWQQRAGAGIEDLNKAGRIGGEKRQFLPDAVDYDSRQRRRTEDVAPVQSAWDDKDGHYVIRLGESLIPRYKILKIIGEGTFGKVTQCWDREKKKYVAIKIIKSIQKYRDAATVEIEILKNIDHKDLDGKRYVSYRSSRKMPPCILFKISCQFSLFFFFLC